jgi:hypothetical protein
MARIVGRSTANLKEFKERVHCLLKALSCQLPGRIEKCYKNPQRR